MTGLIDFLPTLASAAAHTTALGITFEGLQGDRVRLRLPYREDLIGDPGSRVLAGGVVSTLLDHVGGMAVWVRLGEFRPIATLDLRVDYMRTADPDCDLLAEAHCYHLTRSVAFVRAQAFETDPDNPVAAAQAAYMRIGAAGA